MARHEEACARLDGAFGVLEHAPWHLDHPSARIAADVLVVVLRQFVVDLAVPQVDPLDRAVLLHPADRAKNGRVIGGAQRLHNRFMQLVDRPEVLLFRPEKGPDLVANGTRSRHCRPVYAHFTCAMHLCNGLARWWSGPCFWRASYSAGHAWARARGSRARRAR